MKLLTLIVAVLVMATAFLVVGSVALAQSGASAPATGNIAVRDGTNPGEVVVSWDAVPGATHYRIGYVNMVTDYPLAKSSVTGDWISAFIYVDENARNIQVSNGRAEYTIRRLDQGVRHAFTVLTSNNFVDTGGGGSVSSTFTWPRIGSRWEDHTVADRGGAPAPGTPVDYVRMYPNCDAVRAHYPGGVRIGSPIYRPALDSDGDGIACEPADTGSTSASAATDRAALIAIYDATSGENWKNSTNWLSDKPIGEWYGVTLDDSGRVDRLHLGKNQLDGEIPSDVGDLTNLSFLFLFDNNLRGPIPAELGNLIDLASLELSGNHLNGPLPAELGNLVSLTNANFQNNMLNGTIPKEMGNLVDLRVLDLSLNQLTGDVPPKLGNLRNLETLSLWRNRLSGRIPAAFGNLPKLNHLDLSSNRFSGDMPSELGKLASLERLYLSSNQLTGAIPSELGSLVNLRDMDLGNNELMGAIPTELGNLTSLTTLGLGNNELMGAIPTELGSLPNLRRLYLSGNQLTGCIPTVWRYVAVNDVASLGLPFCDPAPTTLPSADRNSLIAFYNATGGPNWINNSNWLNDTPLGYWYGVTADRNGRVTELILQSNHLMGALPPQLGNLANLELLWLDNNRLIGAIPAELGNLANLKSLQLYGNQLTGCIPASLRNVSYHGELPFCE